MELQYENGIKLKKTTKNHDFLLKKHKKGLENCNFKFLNFLNTKVNN